MKTDFLDFLFAQGRLTEQQRDTIRRTVPANQEPLGSIAFAHGLLSAEDVDLVLSQQRQIHQPFGQIAAQLGMLTQPQVTMLLQLQSTRAALALAEALALAGVLSLDTVMAEMATFLVPRAAAAAA